MARFDKGVMSAEGRANCSKAQKRRWSDPEKRAKAIAALRRKNLPAIVTALQSEPRLEYKQIARELQVSKSYVQQIARSAGIRRNRPRQAAADHHQVEDANG